MKPTAKPDPYKLADVGDGPAKSAPVPNPTRSAPPLGQGLDLEQPAAPQRPGSPSPRPVAPASQKPGMDIEAPTPPKEKRAPIAAARSHAAPVAPAAPADAVGAVDATKSSSPARFTETMLGGVHVIAFTRSDVVDPVYIKQVGDDIYRHLKGSEGPKVVVDLANVQFLSSAALGMLVALRTVVVDKMHGSICLANVDDNVKEVFKMMKLHKLIKIHDDTDAAIRSLV